MNPLIIYLLSAKLAFNPLPSNANLSNYLNPNINDTSYPSLVVNNHFTKKSKFEKEINYNGLEIELNYQKELRKTEKTRKNGVNLIVLCDDGKETGLYLGNIQLAAETLKENLTGKTIIKKFYNDSLFLDYLLNPNDFKPDEKIKNVFWFGHGDFNSLWMELTFKDENSYLDKSDLESLSETELIKIRGRFTPNAEMKLYTCHASADNSGDTPIAEILSQVLDINATGANSWVFAKGIKQNGKTKVYFYPATREDYKVEFKTRIPDPLYIGESKWIRFEK